MFPRETHILVVDDSINVRKIINDNLRKLGFVHVEAVGDATTAFNRLVQAAKTDTPFNLILSDLNMPGPSGLDFLKQVRESEKFKDMPFILITTESERQAVIQAALSGVSAYIVKPFNAEGLTKRLQEAWKKTNPQA